MKQSTGGEIKAVGRSANFDVSAEPEFSVLLPTYNRADALRRTLAALEDQTVDRAIFEIIVVDDGSGDDTEQELKKFSKQTETRFLYALLKKNGGPARARNTGLVRCRGKWVLIIGDDIEPASTLLEKHMHFHRQHPEEQWALLGRVKFPKELHANAFMHWLENDGRKYFFNYAELESGQQAGPMFFYTCNVSVKMRLLAKSGWFDESFPYASHEDLELGYRLSDQGMRLMYDATAMGYHWHVLTINGIARRVYLMGHSAGIFWQKVGENGSFARQVVRKVLARLSSLPPMIYLWSRLRGKEYLEMESYPFQWQILLFLGFFLGFSDSRRNRDVRV